MEKPQPSLKPSTTSQVPEANEPLLTSSVQPSPKKKMPMMAGIIILLLILLGGAAFAFKYVQKPAIAPEASPMTAIETPVAAVDPMEGWKTYTDAVHNFTIKYPSEYQLTGQMAASLNDWEAGKGIKISKPTDPAAPEIFIEAVFDGYGPIFPTGEINANFVGDKLVITSTTKKSDAEYAQMVKDGLIEENKELYKSDIIEHNGIPFQFQIKHLNRGNVALENELNQILSTFEFINNKEVSMDEWKSYSGSGVSFQYPPDLEVADDIQGGDPEEDDQLWVAVPGSDGIYLRILVYKSSLSPQEWWNTVGIEKYNEQVRGFAEVVHPRPSSITLPKFTVSSSTLSGLPALMAEGYVARAQGNNVTTTVVNHEGKIYLFEIDKGLYEDGRTEKIGNQILSSLKFTN